MHRSIPSPTKALASNPAIGHSCTLTRGTSLNDCLSDSADEFYLIVSGAVLLYAMNPAGEKISLSIIGGGHVFTPQIIGLFLSSNHRFGAEAMRDVNVRRIPRVQWERAASKQHNLYNWVIDQEAQQLQIVQFHLAQHFQRCSLDRARFALCAYALGIGLDNPCGSKTIRVSRAELATWIGVSCDRMCRLVRTLHDSGEVTVTGRSIKVSLGLLSSMHPGLA
ncbi:Crp/Fnr family transcriptional regulator [Pseudomonas tritici]|uniref:Crp/Fnr family transcriptional regulator n=1 Tax=Pseudomonas tritici TaxID=2745518 RepID=UPI00387AF92F